MEVANASLLDEATAAAEAMALLAARAARRADAPTFVVADRVFPQVQDVLARAREPLGDRRVEFGDPATAAFGPDVFGVYVQSPDDHGDAASISAPIDRARARGRRARGGRHRPARAGARDAARRSRRRRRRRQRAAVWRAARLRRTARGVLRDARALRPAGAGPHHRRLGRQPRAAAPTGWRCRRASSTSGARRRRRTSARRRRCSPTWRRSTRVYHGPDGLTDIAARVHDQADASGDDARRRAAGDRPTRRTSTRSGSRPTTGAGRRGARRPPKRAASISAIRPPGVDSDLAERDGHRSGPRWTSSRSFARGRDGTADRARAPRARRSSLPDALRRTVAVPDASGVQRASLRNRDDALHPAASSGRTSASTRR